MATWLHCSINDGSVVALSHDKNFNKNGNLSSTMRKKFFHVKVADSLETCRALLGPKESIPLPTDKDGPEVIHKFKSYVDIDDFFKSDATLKAQVLNKETEVDPISGFQDLATLVKSR